MPTPKPQFSASKKLIRKVRLPKIGPRQTKGLFEEYFYFFLAAIFLSITILLRAGGMATYDSIVIGLWIAGLTWFARQARSYYKEKSSLVAVKKTVQPIEQPPPATNGKLPPGMKPMIGPQWPLKPGGKSSAPAVTLSSSAPKPSSPPANQKPASPGSGNKPVFVYQRPTLPDRKPKLPANWPGQDKKPKR
jgi:hypothetical protein